MSTFLNSEDFGLKVARGKERNAYHVNKFGFNTSVGNSFESVTDLGTNFLPASAAVISVVSDDANDDDGDTGARSVKIEGLDANYALVDETIALNGTSAVTTTQTFLRVFRMSVASAGSSNTNEGQITASHGGTDIAAIHSDNGGQSLMAVYTVPAGYKAYLSMFQGSISKNQEATFEMRTKNGTSDAAFQNKGIWGTFGSPVTYDYKFPLEIEQKTDIEIRVKAGATSGCGAIFDLLVVKDNSYTENPDPTA